MYWHLPYGNATLRKQASDLLDVLNKAGGVG
jgi:hypothetical protein